MLKQTNKAATLRLAATLGVVAGSAFFSTGTAAQAVQVSQMGAVAARNIGPAGMSGRVAAVDVVLSNPTTIYVGSATGGVFKSVDGGISWNPIFDDQPVLGIGSVAVFQPNPDVVWVGTGEGNPRNSMGVGNGIFKSIDGGDTWKRMGLEGSERIHRVLTHPTDPNIVYAGVMGPAWSDGEVRGVYRTMDGGETWDRILYVDEGTGVGDMVMDPSNPDHLLVNMWDFRREPWFFRSGGPGSGLYQTRDGGDNWTRMTAADGLPEGELGRMGLAFAPSDPNVVYALVEATHSELLRSDDGGRTFETISDRDGVASRPFYYADIRVDPTNENRLYNLASSISVSEDQGRTFRTVVSSGIIHGDVHELWINPANPRHMILGEDGGIAITYDRGDNWRFVENLTLAQFYHVSVDDAIPYNIYGGLQDNGSWFGPSDVWENKGILNAHFSRVGGGDGFWVLPDPSDDRYGYAASQGGALARFDKLTGGRVGVRPIHPDGEKLRFNWNAAVATDPHDPDRLYIGSQYVHMSRDHGSSWQIISPDLTTNDPAKQDEATGGISQDATGAETHTTIIDISPSTLDNQLIWVSTDDGNVQVTRDDGATWTNVRGAIRGVTDGTWAPDVDPSFHDAAVAYAVFEDHRRGDWESWIYRTSDYGQSWNRLDTSAIDGFVHAIAEDPVEPNLLFAGTEFGLWVSFNRGANWQLWNHVPQMPIRDLLVHPRDGDLILGTHGRGLWVVDDIRPLRELASLSGVEPEGIRIFSSPIAYRRPTAEAIGYRSTGMAMWQGETREYGALLSFWVPAGLANGRAAVRILGDDGAVRTASIPVQTGINRWNWNLRAGGAIDDAPEVMDGVEVFPGQYQFTVTVGGETSAGSVEVRWDPREAAPTAQDRVVFRERLVVARQGAAIAAAGNQARTRLNQVLTALSSVTEDMPAGDLRTRGVALRDEMEALNQRLFTGPECQGSCAGDPLAQPVGRAAGISRGWGPITQLEEISLDLASRALDQVLQEVNEALTGPVTDFRNSLVNAGYDPLPDLTPVRRGGD